MGEGVVSRRSRGAHGAGRITRWALCLTLVVAFSVPARADHDSAMTIGVGAGVGILRSAQPGQLSATTFVNQANVRLKLFSLMGIDYSFDLGHEEAPLDGTEVQFAARMRLTAIAYLVPSPKVSFYVGGGVGGASVGELVSVTREGNSYHVGAGLEVYLSPHISVDTSFYMVIPGVRSIERHVEHLALTAIDEQSAAGAGPAGPTASGTLEFVEPGLGDFVSPKNYELMIRFIVFL